MHEARVILHIKKIIHTNVVSYIMYMYLQYHYFTIMIMTCMFKMLKYVTFGGDVVIVKQRLLRLLYYLYRS